MHLENEQNSQDQANAAAWQAGNNEYAHLEAAPQAQPTAEIEQRTPVIDSHLNTTALNREWALVTEAIRREALVEPRVQEALIRFTDQPIGQDTAADMLLGLQDDQRVNKLTSRPNGKLLPFLQLPDVPESAIAPDIANAPRLKSLATDTANYQRWGYDKTAQTDSIRRNVKAGSYTNALSDEERELVARKYAYARDVKLLALGAELTQQGPVQLSDEHEATLPSGIHLKTSPDFSEQAATVLDPNSWKSRKQLKDRVYEVEAGDNKYILKERKTARHTDTRKDGHKDGLTSAEEFEVGQWLHSNASKQEGRIKLSWEEPLGYVEYPDGFQFGIFAFEEGLTDQWSTTELEREIRNHPADFEAEYAQIAEAAEAYKNHPLIDPRGKSQNEKRAIWQKLRRKQPAEEPWTFEQFARIKARRLMNQAEDLYRETVLEAGFENHDASGVAYKLQKDQVGVEIIGFDYEYFRRITPERVAEIKRNTEEYIVDTPRLIFASAREDTHLDQAAYLALMDAEGRLPDSIKHMT